MSRRQGATCAACGYEGPRSWDACPRCRVWGSALPREGAQRARGRVRLGDLADVPITRMRCAEPWSHALGGGLADGSTVLVTGPPGVGKTTELVRLAASLPHALFAPVETGQGPATLHDVARRTATDARDLWIAEGYTLGELCAELARPPAPRAFVLDSLSGLAPDAEVAALIALRRATPRTCAIVAVVHVTKAGTMAGPEKLAHLCDTILVITADAITAEKNRFGIEARAVSPRVTSA